MSITHLEAAWFGEVPYERALALMEAFGECVAQGCPEVLLLMEHPPVVTLGRNADESNLLLSPAEYEKRGICVHHIGRGGDVTYHGPGQLMGYPVARVGRQVTRHVDAMFDTLRELLVTYGIESLYEEEHPGLWVGSNKIAAVGVEIKNDISRHGFSLNVHRQGEGFQVIVPCGLSHRGISYISDFTSVGPMEELAMEFAERYAAHKRQGLLMVSPRELLANHHIQV
ncbi:lipoyl(octanoyl) transferase LipB [Myxococcota bacterium]|nr:lipoyl(octanoyl) transferase LipB [Myxococcota bacterium]MBU1534595.1 lipoyl(octanoyl) transferase LipB [Myxococcota bacterium]